MMINKLINLCKNHRNKFLVTGLSLLVLGLLPLTYLSIQKAVIMMGADRVVYVSKDKEVRVDGPISDLSKEILKINQLVKAGEREINVSISSPGGRLDKMEAFIETMSNAQYHGVEFTCTVTDMAASAAVVILSHCDKRYALFGSVIMWHSAAIMTLSRFNQANTSKLLQFFMIKNEEIWAKTRSYFWPWYFIENFESERMIPASEVEREGFGFVTVISGYKYKTTKPVADEVPVYSPPVSQINVKIGNLN